LAEGEVVRLKKEIYEGTDDYRKLIKDNGYYVDKTLLIEEWMKNKAEVTLITRPRRFGKTLNMTMMKEFFDITTDSKDIFEGTKIMDKPECIKRMNKVPVVFYSFKSCDGKNKRQLLVALKKVIFSEFERYGKIFGNSNKIPEDTFIRFIEYKEIMRSSTVDVEQIEDILPDSILLLTQVLYEYYKIKSIVIIDEYDYPFIEAKVNGYYDEINTILSTMFCEAFKGNKYLDKGIMTGIQKIAQESIFSKFNNPSICSVVDKKYFNKFGLTENETKEYLEYFDYELTDEVKKFYDGYKFNGEDIYNPMSITRYISEDGELERYWVNTSSNVLIKEEIPRASDEFKETFEQLVKNKSCVTNISLNTTFSKKYSDSGLWGLFLNAGYITAEKKIRNNRYKVRIPNAEVRTEFKEIVADYINVKAETLDSLHEVINV